MQGIYSYDDVEKLKRKCFDLGFDIIQLRDGCLLDGKFILYSPGNKYYHFIVDEVYLNEWSSGYKVRRCKKLSKQIEKEIAIYENSIEE